MGAREPPPGLGEKAVPTIWLGLPALTVRCGSLSCSVSPLSDLGIILISKNPIGPSRAGRTGFFAAFFLLTRAVFLDAAFLLFFLAGMILIFSFSCVRS